MAIQNPSGSKFLQFDTTWLGTAYVPIDANILFLKTDSIFENWPENGGKFFFFHFHARLNRFIWFTFEKSTQTSTQTFDLFF